MSADVRDVALGVASLGAPGSSGVETIGLCAGIQRARNGAQAALWPSNGLPKAMAGQTPSVGLPMSAVGERAVNLDDLTQLFEAADRRP